MTFLRQLLILSTLTLIGFALYVLLFWIGAGSSITILFYRGVALAAIAAVITGAVAVWIGRGSKHGSVAIAASAVSLAFNICFLVLLPVTIDRSISVYLLATIERQPQSGINSTDLERAFVGDYVVKMGAIDRRIDEQRRSGNITMSPDGKVQLTDQGRRFMAFSRVVGRLFGTDPRFVSGSAEPQLRGRRNLSKHN
jgi:hypothetical protein